MNQLFSIVLVAVLVMLLAEACKSALKSKKKGLPSGKQIPDDKQLLILSVDQLMTDYSKADRDELLLYVAKRIEAGVPKGEKVKWDDLYRRIHIALYRYY